MPDFSLSRDQLTDFQRDVLEWIEENGGENKKRPARLISRALDTNTAAAARAIGILQRNGLINYRYMPARYSITANTEADE